VVAKPVVVEIECRGSGRLLERVRSQRRQWAAAESATQNAAVGERHA
jgi:hypothetical protein